jgi:type I restriction enzyme M protein
VPNFLFVSDLASTVSQAQVARLADVARAAVSQWRKRHLDFPVSVGGTGDRFLLGEVIGWLDGRSIPASNRAPDETVGATYGGRVRRRLRAAERPDTDLPLRSLRALGPEIRGYAPLADYLYLLLCLAFLRLYDQDRWAQLVRQVPPVGDLGDARRLLRGVVATVDASLGYPDLLSGPDAPPTRLRPRAFEPVRKVVKLAADLRPGDFRRLRADFLREVRVHAHAICTPTSVTRTMVAHGSRAGAEKQDQKHYPHPPCRLGAAGKSHS